MRTDLRYKLTLAAIVAVIPVIFAIMVIYFFASQSIWLALIPLYLLAGGFILTFILGFVPFMKDHMWLSVIAVALLSLIAGVILHFTI